MGITLKRETARRVQERLLGSDPPGGVSARAPMDRSPRAVRAVADHGGGTWRAKLVAFDGPGGGVPAGRVVFARPLGGGTLEVGRDYLGVRGGTHDGRPLYWCAAGGGASFVDKEVVTDVQCRPDGELEVTYETIRVGA